MTFVVIGALRVKYFYNLLFYACWTFPVGEKDKASV